MKLHEYKVYIRSKAGKAGGPFLVKAPDSDEAKIQTQKFLRKRFHVELGRNYEITKAVKVRRGTK
jgi:hypothetical protein